MGKEINPPPFFLNENHLFFYDSKTINLHTRIQVFSDIQWLASGFIRVHKEADRMGEEC